MVGYGIAGLTGVLGVQYWSTKFNDDLSTEHGDLIPLEISTIVPMRDALLGTTVSLAFMCLLTI